MNGARHGMAVTAVVIHGTLNPIDRVAADRPSCSGKHRKHGINLQSSPALAATSCGCPPQCPAPFMT
jgi:hypothetical protein